MSYSGNASLSRDVQERITQSFRQTLDLAAKGNDREAQLGCEFILGMDPLFQPAEKLLQRLQGEQRPIELDDLQNEDTGPSTRPVEIPVVDGVELDEPGDEAQGAPEVESLDLDKLENLEDLEAAGFDASPLIPPEPPGSPEPVAPPAAPGAPDPATGAGGLGVVLQDLLAKRNFDQVLQIARSQQASIEADPQLQALVQKAEAQQESSRYVDSFLASADKARHQGRPEEAEKLLAKAKILDPEHPGIEVFERSDGLEGLAPESPTVETDAPSSVPGFEPPTVEIAAPPEPIDPADAGALPSVEAIDVEAIDVEAIDVEAIDAEVAAVEPEAGEGEAAAVAAPADATDDDESGRIAELLAEGQEAFDAGDYQGAIDVWSRIFLIDIDNAEASERIEEARGRKAELERQAEEIFHEGLGHLETQDLEKARAAFARVLELQPSHSVAREYVEQLDAGQVPSAKGIEVESARASAALELDAGEIDDDGPSLEAAVERDRVVVVKRTDRRLMVLGAGVLVALLAAAGFLAVKWNDLFPNADDAAATVARPPSQIARATALHERGSTASAIKILESVPPEDPQHTQAQALVAQWRALEVAPPPPEPTGPSEAALARRAALVAAAREAIDDGRNIQGRRYLERASKIVPLDDAEQLLDRRGLLALDAISGDLERFESGAWERVLPDLWRRYDAEPDNQDVRLLIIESYYNLAARALQRGDAQDGATKLREAVALDPDNENLSRTLQFAETYIERPQDLLYRIFVKYLPSRP